MNTQANMDELSELCRRLKLPTVARQAAPVCADGLRHGRSALECLKELLQMEADVRTDKRAARRVKEARFPLLKTLEGFDFTRAPHLPATQLMQLAEGDWLERAEGLIFLGEPGTGKTHLAIALGMALAHQGRRVRFVTAAQLANELVEARDAHQLSRAVGRYARVDLLIIDELGYVPLSKVDAELLFQVLGERQERRSVIVTSNLPFSEWTQVFSDPRLCRAVNDRLTHRAHIIETGTESYRLNQARKGARAM